MSGSSSSNSSGGLGPGGGRRVTVAMTGASGAQYGLRLVECLLAQGVDVYLLVSDAACEVLRLELDHDVPAGFADRQTFFATLFGDTGGRLELVDKLDWTSAVASGSNAPDAMVVCPCSSGCVSAIAQGASNNLIERAADVMIKEKKQLIVVHREMPLSEIHLQNLLRLAQVGVTVMPASPGFYHGPSTIDDLVNFVVARVLDHLDIKHDLLARWGS